MNQSAAVKGYLSRNWYKLLLALFLVFIVLKKDLSFQIQLRAPVKKESAPKETIPVEEETKPEVKEKLAEKFEEEPPPERRAPEIEQFGLPGFGKTESLRSSPSDGLSGIEEEVIRGFLERFGHVAVGERKKFGIPASLILANALLISQAGQRELAEKSNNFFALPCTTDWEGKKDRSGNSCYRSYKNAWTSFRDHSLYITSGKLAPLLRFDDDDYKAWARELEEESFYEERNMGRQVIELIEDWQLYELDR